MSEVFFSLLFSPPFWWAKYDRDRCEILGIVGRKGAFHAGLFMARGTVVDRIILGAGNLFVSQLA